MKKILAVTLALATGSAFAGEKFIDSLGSQQRQEADTTNKPLADQGVRHMIDFDAQTLPTLVLGFNRTRAGGSADTGTDLNLGFNYAYGIHRFLQAGFRFKYNSALAGANDVENLQGQVGLILNSDSDFTQAAYLSGYVGLGYEQNFGQGGSREDLRFATLALGKRMKLDRWGINHVTYSPEIALTTTNSTTSSALDYRQALELRFLQFSVFF